MDRSSNETFLELLEKIKENNNDIELIKKAREKMKNSSESIASTEEMLDAMESSGVYLGMTRERIKSYLKEMGILNDFDTKEYIRLKKDNKIRYIRILLHNELEDFKKVIWANREDIKRLLLEKVEYRVLGMIVDMYEIPEEKVNLIEKIGL